MNHMAVGTGSNVIRPSKNKYKYSTEFRVKNNKRLIDITGVILVLL